MMNKRNLVIFLVIYKLFLLAVFIPLAYKMLPFYEASYKENTEFTDDKALNAPSPYKTWDSYNFLYLAKNGYREGHNKFNVLLPLFPMLIKFFLPVFRGDAVLCGIVLSNMFSLIGLLYFYYFARRHYDSGSAFASLLILLAFPTSFYFTVIYSEALFFMLIMMFFYYSFDKKYLLSAVCAFFLPMTRVVGMAAALIFIVVYFENLKIDGAKGFKDFLKKIRPDIAYLTFPALGFLGLMLFFYFYTHNAFEWLDSQGIYIAGHNVANALNPLKTLWHNFFQSGLSLHGYTNSIIDRIMFILFALSMVFIYKKQRFSLFLYAFLSGILPAVSSNMMSYTRYIVVAFPLYYFLGTYFNIERNKACFFMILIIFALMQGLFLTRHVNYYWVG